MFEGQPKGLYALALANTGERFGYYTMLAIFVLFLRANFDLSASTAGNIYAAFLALVYFLPFIGGILADKFGYGKMVTFGIIGMFVGYVLLALPLGSGAAAWVSMVAGLLVISTGTGLFKGNLQVMVGNLYDDPAYASKRDSAFSIFYMAINIGALFAPTAAVEIMEYLLSLCLWCGLCVAHRVHGHLLRFPGNFPSRGRLYQADCCGEENRTSRGIVPARNEGSHCGPLPGVRRGYLLLDGFPSKRFDADLLCR